MSPEDILKLPYRQNVGVMIVNGENHVWVGQRLDSEVPAWQMPQGGIDKGEDPKVAALRELEEETGIAPDQVVVEAETDGWMAYDLPHDIVPKIWKGRYRGQEQKWFLMRYLGPDEAIVIEQEHPEFSEWRWLPVDDLVDNIVPFKRAVYEQVVAAFRQYL